jgi:MoaA/NifB/PqqE/SkfB family radical SAM enzyme
MKQKIMHHGDYISYFDPKTGLHIRGERPDGTDPEWSPSGPELMDIHITNYCPMTCAYCYRESNPNKSTHMDPADFKALLQDASPWVCQVAIGGGSPQHHPQFLEILQIAHEMGIPPSYTSNGLDMTEEILEATKEFCGAVAISLHDLDTGLAHAKRLIDYGLNTAIHVVLHKDAIDFWTGQLLLAKEGKGYLNGDIPFYTCIFLMHKPIGRGSWEQHPSPIQKRQFARALHNYEGPIMVGIDSCAAPSLVSIYGKDELPQHAIGPCDSGCFSMFVGEDMVASPCSFNKTDMFSLEEFSFEDVWKNKFKPYREKVMAACPDCQDRSMCRSCQVLPPINPCNSKDRTV